MTIDSFAIKSRHESRHDCQNHRVNAPHQDPLAMHHDDNAVIEIHSFGFDDFERFLFVGACTFAMWMLYTGSFKQQSLSICLAKATYWLFTSDWNWNPEPPMTMAVLFIMLCGIDGWRGYRYHSNFESSHHQATKHWQPPTVEELQLTTTNHFKIQQNSWVKLMDSWFTMVTNV